MPLVWIHRGPLEIGRGQFRELSDEDAQRAEAEEWGQILTRDLLPNDYKFAEAGPHAAADAYAEERGLMGRGTSVAAGRTYGTREMRAAPPGQEAPPADVPQASEDTEADDAEAEENEAETGAPDDSVSAPRRRGRPPKTRA